MLVLKRKRDESIMIGDDIEITIVDIRGDTVRVGINAPQETAVHRKEVYDSIALEEDRQLATDWMDRSSGAATAKPEMEEETNGD